MADFSIALEDAKVHARSVFPEESCGLIVGGKYIRCDNVASSVDLHEESPDCRCKLCSFEISPKVYAAYGDKIQMVVHSHPNGPHFPSQADMEAQVLTDKPWAIIALDDERVAAKATIWGGKPDPLLGREFMHGVHDCYSVIRDAYALGKDELAKQGIEGWPFDPIDLPEYPRSDSWWEQGGDLYEENFRNAGFEETKEPPMPGDVFLMSIRSSKLNHGGILIGNGLIVHHLPSRLSRREPAGLWGRQATKWLRYKGSTHNA